MIFQNGALVLDQWYEVGNGITCASQCSINRTLSNGNFTWWIRGWNAGGGYGVWGLEGVFTVNVPPPSPINMISPLNNADASAGTVMFTWTQNNNATWYLILIYRNGQLIVNQWLEVGTTVTCNGQCSANFALTSGNYTWWIRGWNAGGGNGEWGAEGRFNVIP
jgi:hypothetical protein